jgi:hypothetical protein
MIRLLHVRNPLQPSVGREDRELVHVEGRKLPVYLFEALFDTCAGMTVSVNGLVIETPVQAQVILRDGDCIVVMPKLEGGSLLRTLATLAVIAAAAAVSAGLLVAAGPLIANSLAGAILLGGNTLVNTIFSNPSAKTLSQTYDPDGPNSLARSGTVIPRGGGTFRSGGNIISSFTDIDGTDQYINALVCYGFGPARAINEIQIAGKDIADYGNVQYYTRLGTNDQTPIQGFTRTVNEYAQATQCLAGIPVIIPGTGTETQALEVDVQFPDGVFVNTNDNNLITAVITYLVEYSVSGANDWITPLFPYTTQDIVQYHVNGDAYLPNAWGLVATDLAPASGVVYATDNGSHNPGDVQTVQITCETFAPNGNHSTYNKSCTGEWQLLSLTSGQVLVTGWRAGYQDFVGANRSTLYNRTNIYGLATGKYDVRITKYGSARQGDNVQPGDNAASNIGQEIWVHSVNEVSFLTLAYPNMILVGVRALATNQISGSNLNITAEIQYGLRTVDEGLMPAALQNYAEDNPACVSADMMLDDLYGGGSWPSIQQPNIQRFIDEWLAWANLNDELVDNGSGLSIRRHIFNGVFDSESNLWESLGKVTKMSRAAILQMGRDYGVFIDAPADPVQMFTMGNILKDSFQETWLDIDSRANQIEITIADKTRFYKTDNPLVYMDPANQDSGAVIKNTRIDGFGITDPAQAWHLARYKELSTSLCLRTGMFKTDIDGIAARPGNVIILQHDVPAWGQGGRTLPGSTATHLKLDRTDLAYVAGSQYNVVVLHPALERYTGTVTGVTVLTDAKTDLVTGTQVTLSAFDNVNRVTRLIVGGVDSPVSSSAAGLVVIQPAAGFAASVGQAFTLWDTDVLETRTVVGVSVEDGNIVLGSPLSQVPQDFSTYIYGLVGAQKLVRILSIRKSSDFKAAVEWIDYEPGIYVDATPVIGETSAQTTSMPAVSSLTGAEIFQRISGSYVGYASLSWTLGRDTAGVAVYGQLVGSGGLVGLPTMLARLTNRPTTWQMQVDAGQNWEFTVVGFDASNNYASFTSAPHVTINAVGIAVNLLFGSSFSSGFTFWSISPRAGDSLVPTLGNDGSAVYTVAGSTLTVAQRLFFQVVASGSWSVGQSLMLSAYVQDACASASAPNVGNLVVSLVFFNASWAVIGQVDAPVAMNGVTPTLTRVNTAATVIPAGTAYVEAELSVAGTGLSLPVGSVLSANHFLLEVTNPGQTSPSEWAEIDAAGQIEDLFTTGASTGLRVQASTVPATSGTFAQAFTSTTATISWSGLAILWPDAGITYIPDGSLVVAGLTASTSYYAFPYFDVVLGGLHFAVPVAPLGTPAYLSATVDSVADAACRQDGRISLAPGGMAFTLPATGSTSTGTGGGTSGGSQTPTGGGLGDRPPPRGQLGA